MYNIKRINTFSLFLVQIIECLRLFIYIYMYVHKYVLTQNMSHVYISPLCIFFFTNMCLVKAESYIKLVTVGQGLLDTEW